MSTLTYQRDVSNSVSRDLSARLSDAKLCVHDFGNGLAQGSDDTAAFNAALAHGEPVYVPRGVYNITGPLNFVTGSGLVGSDSLTSIVAHGSGPIFDIAGWDTGIDFLRVEGGDCSGPVIRFRTDQLNIRRFNASRMVTNECAGIVRDASGINNVAVATFRDIVNYAMRADGVNVSRLFAFNYFDQFVAEFIGSDSPDHSGFVVSGFEGLILKDCTVDGTVSDDPQQTIPTSQHAIVATSGASLWMERFIADSVGGNGLLANGLRYVQSSGSRWSQCYHHSNWMADVDVSIFDSDIVHGRRGMAVFNQFAQGVRLDGGCDDFERHGIIEHVPDIGLTVLGNCSSVGASGSIMNCGTRGLHVDSTGQFNGAGIRFRDNPQDYHMSGADHHLQASAGNSGSINISGPASG